MTVEKKTEYFWHQSNVLLLELTTGEFGNYSIRYVCLNNRQFDHRPISKEIYEKIVPFFERNPSAKVEPLLNFKMKTVHEKFDWGMSSSVYIEDVSVERTILRPKLNYSTEESFIYDIWKQIYPDKAMRLPFNPFDLNE